MSKIPTLLAKLSERGKNALKQVGTVGKPLTGGTYQVGSEDGDRPGFITVMIGQGNNKTPIEALNMGVGINPNTPVEIVYNEMGIALAYPRALDAQQFYGSAAGAIGFVPPHTHEIGGGSPDLVSGRRFKDGLIHVTQPTPSMSITIERFSYAYGGLNKIYAGGNFDLTSYQPATANTFAWVIVGYNPETEAIEAAAGSEYVALALMDESQIEDIAFEGRIILGALRLGEADTAISEDSRFASNPDMRHFIGGVEAIGLSKAVVGSDGNVVTSSGEIVWLL